MSLEEGGIPRSAERDSMFLSGVLRTVHGEELGKAIIRNLSATGMLAEGSFNLKRGDIVRFSFGSIGELSGEVVRVEEGCCGIQFHREIDPVAARRRIGSAAPAHRGK
ncbi:MAG: PilZ domain-containing protein [Sphingobium sp.]|nr:PilZ domain-containing protein [Sphingobium sp.]MBP6111781.1 PilZ domain-containing protein [Sphingobium sp.]MBP8671247.1 PilZ domain-containing protein [Sphingobium sp.]MBP9156312.1 PilZ domain-containing protein [Sphingobium sp.]